MVKIRHKISTSTPSGDKRRRLIVPAAIAAVVVLVCLLQSARCAPTSSPSGQANNRNQPRLRLLGNLFRRQTDSQPATTAATTTTTTEGSSGAEGEEPQNQIEADAQKFLDSMPGAQNQNSGPSSFRERVSDTFGLLREGVSNQFRSLRENFSDTVEELRDTWSSGSGTNE